MLKVYLKELLELTRDKKTLIFTILLPTLIMPIILLGFFALSVNIATKAKEETLNFAIVGSENYRAIEATLTGDEKLKFKLTSIEADQDINELINQAKIRFAIVIPETALSDIDSGLSANIEFRFNDSASTSDLIFRRVSDALEQVMQNELDNRYQKLGLTKAQGEAFADPIKLVRKSTANERESLGEKLGALLPYILIIIGLSGAMYPALDLGVGEKERGTLETLLLTPVPRFHLVFAKFAVIFTTSFLSIFLSLISFSLVTSVFGPLAIAKMGAGADKAAAELLEVLATISIVDVLLMFSMLIPIAAIFASLLLSVSIYARTFKEAQNYMSPIMMVVIFPLVLSLLPGVKLDWFWASVPITNVSLAIKEIFKGTIDLSMLAVIFVSTTIIAGLLLSLCNWWFQREQVLFRN